MRNFILYAVLFFAANGCLEKLDVPIISNKPVLVVDGLISDEPGPYVVKLFWSSALDKDLDHPKPLAGATVTIADNEGNSEVLQERIPGTYETDPDGLRGVVGRHYLLAITTGDGKVYQSETIPMTPAGEISDLFYEFRQNSINPDQVDRPQDAFSVFVNSKGVEGYTNLFRWRWTGIYHVKTFPELREREVTEDGVTKFIPDPLPCSGYIANGSELVYVKPCECCDCYVSEYSNDAMLSPNTFVGGEAFTNIPVSQIAVDKWRFYDRYYIEVEQLSLSGSVYDFWRLVQRQQQGTGDIFQPNAVKVRGNIKGVTDPDEEVFGIFSVSAIAKKSMFIHRTDIPERVPQIDTLTGDCRHAFFNSSAEKPPFW